jgi:hypothetical protein
MRRCYTSGGTRGERLRLAVGAGRGMIGFVVSGKNLVIYCIVNAEYHDDRPNLGEAGTSFLEETYLGLQ